MCSLETGRPSDRRQTTLNIGSAITREINAVKPLLRISLHVARQEQSVRSFVEEVELNKDNGANILLGYDSDKACQNFIHLLADEIYDSRIVSKLSQPANDENRGKTNFCSFMIDDSQTAKRKLTDEGGLIYIRSAPSCVVNVEFSKLVSMKP